MSFPRGPRNWIFSSLLRPRPVLGWRGGDATPRSSCALLILLSAAELPQVRANARTPLLFPAAADGLLAAQQLLPVLLHQAPSFLDLVQ